MSAERRPAVLSFLEGRALLRDPQIRQVYTSVQRGLSVNSFDVLRKLNKSNPKHEISFPDIEEKLSTLVTNGLILRDEPEPGGLPLFSPTSQGIRILQSL